jgi:peptide/nickel transport system ATP-binding protein
MRKIRGRSIWYVPQNPGTALNPSSRIGDAIEEMIRAHRQGATGEGALDAALDRVGLPGTADFRRRYPHPMCFRPWLASAVSNNAGASRSCSRTPRTR